MPFGITSFSVLGSSMPLLFRSSPSVLRTTPPSLVNSEEKVMSSSGVWMPVNGLITSGRSIWRFRFRSRTSRPVPNWFPAG